MNDVADILQTRASPSPPAEPEQGAAQAAASGKKQKKPKGMSREVFALAAGDAAAAAAIQEVTEADEIPKLGRKFKIEPSVRARPWQWAEFSNSARSDGLHLKHWKRKPIVIDEYPFARFNKPVYVISYTDSIYEQDLNSSTWTKQETDALISLCRRYDCRWPLVHDRWPPDLPPRTITELRARYFEIAKLLVSKYTEEQLLGNRPVDPIMAKLVHDARSAIKSFSFDQTEEEMRKQAIDAQFNRSKEEETTANQILSESQRLNAELRKLQTEKRKLEERKAAMEAKRRPKSRGGKREESAIKRIKHAQGLNVSDLESFLNEIFVTPESDVYLRSDICMPLLLGPTAVGKGGEIVRRMSANQVKALAQALDRDGANDARLSTAKIAETLTECRKDAVRLVVYEQSANNIKAELKKV